MRSGAISITHPPRAAAYSRVSESAPGNFATCVRSASATNEAPLFFSPAAASPANPFNKLVLAFVAHSRRSGCECSSHFSSSGFKIGINGVKSRTSSTNAQMFPHVIAAFFLISIARSRRPRMMTGRITANEGASMEFTNVVSMSLSRQSSVSLFGLRMADITSGSIPRISAFFTHRQIGAITASATADTLGCVSNTHSRNWGKISGSVRMKYPGTRVARSPHTPSAPIFDCHALCSIANTKAGDKSFIAVTGSDFTTAAMASSAPCRTVWSTSPRLMNTVGARDTALGSNALPAVAHKCAYRASAPARSVALFLFANAAATAETTPREFTASPPAPFNKPAHPAAACLRVVTSVVLSAVFLSSSIFKVRSLPSASASVDAARDATKHPSSPRHFSAFKTRVNASTLAVGGVGGRVVDARCAYRATTAPLAKSALRVLGASPAPSTVFASAVSSSADLPAAASPETAARATESAASRTSSDASPMKETTWEVGRVPSRMACTNGRCWASSTASFAAVTSSADRSSTSSADMALSSERLPNEATEGILPLRWWEGRGGR